MSKRKNGKWTDDYNFKLAKEAVDRFGPYRSWEPRHGQGIATETGNPGRERLAEYQAWCDGFAAAGGFGSGDAVGLHLMEAVIDGKLPSSGGFKASVIRMIVAALAAGFITYEEALARLTALEQTKARKPKKLKLVA